MTPRRSGGSSACRLAASWRRLSCLAVFVLALGPTAAAAQPPGDASRRALAFGYEGDDLYARGQWAAAYERFENADKLLHSPVFVLYMARCRKNAGRLLEAREIYRRVASDALPSDAPKPFKQAVADARSELEEIESRIPRLHVIVQGDAAGDAVVRVDDRVVRAQTDLELDPGTHHVTASKGSRVVDKSVSLADGGGAVRLELSFVNPKEPAPVAVKSEGSLAPTVVALSVGIVGIGVGAVTGGLAASRTSDIEKTCLDGHCPRSSQSDLDSAGALATTSTVGFVVGGVGVATAVVLYLVRPSGGVKPTAALASGGPGRLLVVGSF